MIKNSYYNSHSYVLIRIMMMMVMYSQSIWSAVKRIHSTEGVRGFYKGFGPTLLTGVPYVMLQMTFFELYKRYPVFDS